MTTNVQIAHLAREGDLPDLCIHVDNVERDAPHALVNPSAEHVAANDERRHRLAPHAFSNNTTFFCHSTQSLKIHHPSMNSRTVLIALPNYQQGAVLQVTPVDAKSLEPLSGLVTEIHEGQAKAFIVYGHQSLIVKEVHVHKD
jgi:hypothetical protein